jgi:hypothetical protein
LFGGYRYALNGEQIHKFAGADARQLRSATEKAILMADQARDKKQEEATEGGADGEGRSANDGDAHDNTADGSATPRAPTPAPDSASSEQQPGEDAEGKTTFEFTGTELLALAQAKLKEFGFVLTADSTTNAATDGAGTDTGTAPTTGDAAADEMEDMFITRPEYQASIKYGVAEHVEKVIIVGGGPAGLSAAIYAARAGMTPLIARPSTLPFLVLALALLCPRTMHHAPCTMHHAPCTMHQAPCTMHHAPCTPTTSLTRSRVPTFYTHRCVRRSHRGRAGSCWAKALT